jgi:hypothetical protein
MHSESRDTRLVVLSDPTLKKDPACSGTQKRHGIKSMSVYHGIIYQLCTYISDTSPTSHVSQSLRLAATGVYIPFFPPKIITQITRSRCSCHPFDRMASRKCRGRGRRRSIPSSCRPQGEKDQGQAGTMADDGSDHIYGRISNSMDSVGQRTF